MIRSVFLPYARTRWRPLMNSQSAIRHLSTKKRILVSTSVQESFTVPLTLVDVHLRDEQLPFAYFFNETLDAEKLESSLQRVLASFPLLGGRVNLERGVIECHPDNSVSLSFGKSKMTLQEWLNDAPTQRLTPSRPSQVLSQLFDCLLMQSADDDKDKQSHQRNSTLASIRVTHFEGGGTALGVNLSHALADAASCVRFVQCWGREMQGLEYPTASNKRSQATCSGMLSPQVLDLLDLTGAQKQEHEKRWSVATMLLALGIDWNSVGLKARPEEETDPNNCSHEYISLTFSPELLKAMKAHGMAHCSANGSETDFVSTNDVLTAFGWLMKRHLSGRSESNMSMVVNLRGRSDVDDFSHIEDGGGTNGVFGNGIASIVATLPCSGQNDTVELNDLSAAAVTIRLALIEGLSDIPDRLVLSRHGRPASVASSSLVNCFAFTSWQHFPLFDISFSQTGETLAAFRGHPSHPLPEGDTYNSIIVPEKCGSHTYQLLAPSSKVPEVEAFFYEMSLLFLDWYDNHISKQDQSV